MPRDRPVIVVFNLSKSYETLGEIGQFILIQRPKQTHKRLSRRTKPIHRKFTSVITAVVSINKDCDG
jgi:hypothetical protein